MLVTRALKLAVYPNASKLDAARYTYEKHKLYTQHFLTQLYFAPPGASRSTKGMGQLANKAQHKARGMLSAHRASTKATENKSNIPQATFVGCPAAIEVSKDSSFDYWLKIESQFSNKKTQIPVKSHKRLNSWLKRGYALNPTCELVKDKNGKLYAIVFVQMEVAKATPNTNSLGCDVGYTNSVARSDGYIGPNTAKVIKKNRARDAERRRQAALQGKKHESKSVKSTLKQLLDVEAHRAVRVAQTNGWNLVIENPKVLANLSSGKLQGWARTYFAKRCYELAQENEVFVWAVSPAYTSQTCSNCGLIDKKSRVNRANFVCTACKSAFHADVNAALNIALKGTASLLKLRFKMRSGAVKGLAVSG